MNSGVACVPHAAGEAKQRDELARLGQKATRHIKSVKPCVMKHSRWLSMNVTAVQAKAACFAGNMKDELRLGTFNRDWLVN